MFFSRLICLIFFSVVLLLFLSRCLTSSVCLRSWNYITFMSLDVLAAASDAECILYYHIQLHVIVNFFGKNIQKNKKNDIECLVEIRALLNWKKYIKKEETKKSLLKEERERKKDRKKKSYIILCVPIFYSSHRIAYRIHRYEKDEMV